MRRLGWCGMCLVALSAAACNSDGRPLDPFSGFSEIEPDSRVQIDGIGRVAEYETVAGDVTMTSSTEVDVTAIAGVDTLGEVDSAEVRTDPPDPFSTGGRGASGTGVAFDAADGDTFEDAFAALSPAAAGFTLARSANGDQVAIAANPVAQGFEHQTFGVWANGVNAGTGVFGAASLGDPAPRAPSSGFASYRGAATGVFVDADGTDRFTFADFGADLDFARNTMAVFTDNTAAVDRSTLVTSPMTSLDFRGEGALGQPFSIVVANGPTTPALSGTLTGQFYGPEAQEIGGTFDLGGTAGERYMGAVGGVR